MVMKGGLVSQVGSTETLAPKVAGGERLSMTYGMGICDRAVIPACAPCIQQFRQRRNDVVAAALLVAIQAVSAFQAVFSSDNFGG
jgi:hypothetical protein